MEIEIAATVSITAVTGSPKRINGDYAGLTDSLFDNWDDTNAATISTPYTLPSGEKTLILSMAESTVTIQFSASSAEADGQGVKLPGRMYGEITAVSGSVYFVSDKYLKLNDTVTDAYTNSNKVSLSANDHVGGGFIVCDKNGSFSIKITSKKYSRFCTSNNEVATEIYEIWVQSGGGSNNGRV